MGQALFFLSCVHFGTQLPEYPVLRKVLLYIHWGLSPTQLL